MMFRAWLKSRIFAASVVAALALFASGRAQAQLLGAGGTTITTGTGGSTGTSTFSSSDFFVGVQQTQGVNLSDFDVARFFNQARCNCSTPVYLFIAIQPQSVGKLDGVLRDVHLVVERRVDVDGRVGDEQRPRVGGCVDDEDVAHAPCGAQARLRIEHGVHEHVRVEAPLHEPRRNTLAAKRDGPAWKAKR